jgi:hypothetical protein
MSVEDAKNELYASWRTLGQGEAFPWDQEPVLGSVLRRVLKGESDLIVGVESDGRPGTTRCPTKRADAGAD